jgi:transposase-like protein
MAQHYLHSSAQRNFSLINLMNMSEDDVRELFAKLRWNSSTHQACPRCGHFDQHYERKTMHQWRCKSCHYNFSVTSNTVFSNHKKPLKTILIAAFLFTSAAKGHSALHMSRNLSVCPKTAFTIQGKFKEALFRTQNTSPLKGTIEIDGGYFGGKPRKTNQRGKLNIKVIESRLAGRRRRSTTKPWLDRGMSQLNWRKRKNRRVVMILRERSAIPGQGALRSIVAIAKSENDYDARALVRKFVAEDAVIMTDESPAYSALSMTHEHHVVCHSKEYVTADGVSDNQAESFFSRFRRWEYGVTHGVRPKYLADYAGEMVWRENFRRLSLKERLEMLISKSLQCGSSHWWRGYCQGKFRQREILMNEDLSLSGGKAQ